MKTAPSLLVGLLLVSLLLGFLVGGSGSPSMATALTATFLMVPTVLTALQSVQRTSLARQLASTATLTADQVTQNVSTLDTAQREEVNRMGWGLAVFAVGFFCGLLAGAHARIDSWLKPEAESRPLPWSDRNRPPTAKNALDWIVVQERLHALGYSSAQIRELYEVQRMELERAKDQPAVAAAPVLPPALPVVPAPTGAPSLPSLLLPDPKVVKALF